MREIKTLPNIHGFRFIAVMIDGTLKEDMVYKGMDGLHRISDYRNTIGWFPLNTKQ